MEFMGLSYSSKQIEVKSALSGGFVSNRFHAPGMGNPPIIARSGE
jgi:hypothetical protein